jgi:glycosyltransferase involved in cell wall biosynthesis
LIAHTPFPLVSVVIPTYNRGYALHKTIQSVINQTYKNYEIIIVDDGSTDDTKNVVSAFGNKLFYIQKPHTGQGDTRNVGLQHAKGDIIAPLDSDDSWHEDFLEKSVGYMLEHKLDMFFSNWEHYISLKKSRVALAHFSKNRKMLIDGCYLFDYLDFRKILIKDNLAPSSALIIKKSCIAFGWNAKVYIGDDSFLQLEMIFKNPNCRVGFTKEVLLQKNVDGSNICDGRRGIAFRKLHIQDLQLVLRTFNCYLKENEREIVVLKIIQNKILIFYYLFSERNIGKEMKQLFIELISQPKLLFIALKTGILKMVIRKIEQI